MRARGVAAAWEAMRWLLRRGVQVYWGAIECAAGAGRLEAVQFLHRECGLQLTEGVFRAAAFSGSLCTATWLRQAGCPMSPGTYVRAVAAGDAAMVRWLVQEAGCLQGDESVVQLLDECRPDGGAEDSSGCLDGVVRALAEVGFPYGDATIDAVIHIGNLPLLRYLHDECGVGFGPETLAKAAEGASEAVLEWLVGAGCGLGAGNQLGPYVEAGGRGDLATLSCLHRLGVPWGAQLLRWIRHSCLPKPVLRWLVEHGAP